MGQMNKGILMKKYYLILLLLLFLFLFIKAKAPIGKVDLIIGSPQIERASKFITAKYNLEIFNDDIIKTKTNDKISVNFGNLGKINIVPERKVSISDILKEINKDKKWYQLVWQKLSKLMKNDDLYYYGPTAVTGVRGIPNEIAIKRWMDWVDNYIKENQDSDEIPGLLLLKAEYYNNLGNKSQAINEYHDVVSHYKGRPEAEIAKDKIELLTSINKGNIAIPGIEGKDKELNELITGILVSDLSKSGQLSLVERKDLDKIINEVKLGALGIIKDDEAIKIGKISGVEDVLLGSYSIVNDKLIINVRLIEVETAKILQGFSIEGKINSPEFYAHQLAFEIHHYLTGDDINDQELTGKNAAGNIIKDTEILLGFDKEGITPEYVTNEKMKIKFEVISKVTKEYYVTIINISSEGDINLLYPNQLHQDNKVEPNKIYEIPGDNDGFNLEVYGKPGKATVVGIVTEQPFNLLDKEQFKTEILPEINDKPDNLLKARGGVMVKIQSAKINNWAIGEVHFIVK